jgi:truncated hemoglobin YjbI
LELSHGCGGETHRARSQRRELLDKKIREVYGEFGSSADEIVVDDEISRRFTEAVKRVLAGNAGVNVKEVKKRLLNLRRRGEARGGLPRRKG